MDEFRVDTCSRCSWADTWAWHVVTWQFQASLQRTLHSVSRAAAPSAFLRTVQGDAGVPTCPHVPLTLVTFWHKPLHCDCKNQFVTWLEDAPVPNSPCGPGGGPRSCGQHLECSLEGLPCFLLHSQPSKPGPQRCLNGLLFLCAIPVGPWLLQGWEQCPMASSPHPAALGPRLPHLERGGRNGSFFQGWCEVRRGQA